MEKCRGYSSGVLTAVCAQLAKACEKQMEPEASSHFYTLAQYFASITSEESSASLKDLTDKVSSDSITAYVEVEAAGQSVQDRGALRCATWGKKVTAIHKSLLGRYEKQGEALMKDNQVYVCEACGFIALAKQVPPVCPICKAPSSRFISIT
jgi:rubrerythrin